MAIEQDGDAVPAVNRGKLPLQPLMVGQPDGAQPLGPLFVAGRFAFPVKRVAGEVVLRDQTGRKLAGIERRVVGRPVQVGDIARPDGLEGRDAQFVGEIVQPVEMPVGIRPHQRAIGHPGFDGRRDRRPDMGNAHQERRVSRYESIGREAVRIHALHSTGKSSPASGSPTSRPRSGNGGECTPFSA